MIQDGSKMVMVLEIKGLLIAKAVPFEELA